MNIQTRNWSSAEQIKHLKLEMNGLLVEGEDAATLLDAINGMLEQSSYTQRKFGSVFLGDIAETMRYECEVFNEQELEIHEAEMKGEEA